MSLPLVAPLDRLKQQDLLRCGARPRQMEWLEPRRLLAASIDGRVLTVLGGAGNDAITVTRSGADDVRVSINGTVSMFDTENFDSVVVSGVGGNDTMTIGDGISNASLVGGSGNDRLTDGDGSNTLLGGDGDDTLVPGAGDDSISGGGGTDTVDYSGHAAGLNFSLTSFMRPEGPTVTRTGETDTLATFLGEEDDRILDTERFIGTAFNDGFHYQASENDQDSGFPTVTMEGRGGNDTFSNGGTFDRFVAIGGDGDDRFTISGTHIGSAAETTLIGGDGNDTFNFGSDTGPDSVDGGGGIDFISLSFFTQSVVDLNEFASVENALSGAPDVLLIGTPGPNRLETTRGGTVRGGDGDDTLVGSHDPDSLLGEGGNDSLVGNDGDDTLDGGTGTDTLIGNLGNDTLVNGEVNGQDDLPGFSLSAGVLAFTGTDANNEVSIWRDGTNLVVWLNGDTANYDYASITRIELLGNGGNDLLKLHHMLAIPAMINGGTGTNRLIGGAGSDTITGGTGNDHITGNRGSDFIDGRQGSDIMLGGPGYDTVDYSWRNVALVIGLDGWQDDGEAGENDLAYLDIERVLGGHGNDRIGGSSADNQLYGGPGDDTIGGHGGNDSLFGEAGNDKVHGDDGDDYIEAGAGHDKVYGNGGADILLGLAGNDQLFSAGDGIRDTVSGGLGTDSADSDELDVLSGVEIQL